MEAVYVHIPFCSKICTYCDFPKVLHIETFVEDYLESLRNEILNSYKGEKISSIYVGGGTPSCMTKKERVKLFNILEIFNKTPNCEYTFECNPKDINEDLLDDLITGGVNRVSIGVESFDKKNLKVLGRYVEFDDLKEKIKAVKLRGIDNINLDLMYAIPGENLDTLKKDINLLLKLKPAHISTYSLIIEDHTQLKNSGTEYISEDLDAKMYNTICKMLTKNNFKHYEVSNFALEGMESRHNLKYWNNEEYYGFGMGASGYVNGIRYTNVKSIHTYIKGKYRLIEQELTEKDVMDNEVMLGLRKIDGINVDEFFSKYKKDIQKVYPNIKKLIMSGELIYENGYLKISPDKIYVMNEILIKII